MAQTYSVSLTKVIKDNALEILATPKDPSQLLITSREVNRPGLMLCGHDGFFDPSRAQFLGKGEFGYLDSLDAAERKESLERFFSARPACVIITRSIEPPEELVPLAIRYKVPVLRSGEHVYRDCLLEAVGACGQKLYVAGEGGGVAGDVDQALCGGGDQRVHHGAGEALSGGIDDHGVKAPAAQKAGIDLGGVSL